MTSSRQLVKKSIERASFAAWRLATRKQLDKSRYGGFFAAATYTPWNADEEFVRLHTQVSEHTLVDVTRLYELYDLVGQLGGLAGDILEVGVWRGGSGCLMAAQAARSDPAATVFLADTFSGVVKASDRDPNYSGGEHSDTSVETVRRQADSMGLQNVELLVGIFPDDTQGRLDDRRFKLVHVDVDTYTSAADVTRWIWPRLSTGGVVVYDDYGTPTTSGVRELVDEIRSEYGALRIHNLNQHAVLVKR